ncbi:hypothetical protein K2Z84_06645, partial [Candidatus Binatia bacterium]|nr:hypothetical protein [Candidatus Binatia bacterium]
MIRLALAAVVALHLALLAASLGDYRVSVDSAYHVALARQYGEHGTYWWDDIHYAPAHRPNLQGPAVHVAVGAIGRVLGGTGDDYVRANAIVGLLGWLAAVVTLAHFARREGGDRAALLAVAAFTGSAFASASFSVNLPSGWLFVVTPWAIDAFLRGRSIAATLLATVACYTHLGGFLTAPFGLVVAALLQRRFAALLRVAVGVACLTAPYWLHFLRGLPWYLGRKGDTSWMIDPLLLAFWLVGLVAAVRTRRTFLIAWGLAPLAWLLQDASRFLLQGTLAGAALGGVAIAGWLEQPRRARVAAIVTAALVLVATLFPLGPPALGAEALWLVARFPRMLDWHELRRVAAALPSEVDHGRIVQGYAVYVPSGLAVWRKIEGERGHWVEVQPQPDPAFDIPAGDKVYVLALPPDDDALHALASRGWLQIHGGGEWMTVLTLASAPPLDEARANLAATLARDAAWIGEHCEHNAMGDIVSLVLDPTSLTRRRAARNACRTRVARVQLALLETCHALQASDPARA